MIGSAEAGTTVKLYATADCSGVPLATGTAAALSAPGIEATVPADETTLVRATATDTGNVTSACGDPIAYVNDRTAPAAPELVGTTPASPSETTTTRVLGTAEALSEVRLYTNPDCSGQAFATLNAAALADPGAELTVATDSTTQVRGTATDAAGNTSSCGTPIEYVHRTPLAPPVPQPPVEETPPVTPPEVAPPTITPPDPPAAYLEKTKIVIGLDVTPLKGKRCPATVTATISAKGLRTKRVKLSVRRTGAGAGAGACSVSKTVNLGAKAGKLRSVKITVSGKGVKTRKLTARRA